MRFTKMHGIGNDYIYVDCMDGTFGGADRGILTDDRRIESIVRRLSDRHCGIGGDGLIMILPSDKADFKMRMFNADGSEGRMCGNGTRCIGKYVFDHNHTTKNDITLETLAGIKRLHLFIGADDKVESVRVDMGAPLLSPQEIPAIVPDDYAGGAVSVSADGLNETIGLIPVSMGNPHGVVFVDEVTDRLVHHVGPKLEIHSMWPDRANIEFARMISPSEIEMRVWERGSGETMACGTGACATAVAAMITGRAKGQVTVHLLGGDLMVEWNGDPLSPVFMTGPAAEVFRGEVEI